MESITVKNRNRNEPSKCEPELFKCPTPKWSCSIVWSLLDCNFEVVKCSHLLGLSLNFSEIFLSFTSYNFTSSISVTKEILLLTSLFILLVKYIKDMGSVNTGFFKYYFLPNITSKQFLKIVMFHTWYCEHDHNASVALEVRWYALTVKPFFKITSSF